MNNTKDDSKGASALDLPTSTSIRRNPTATAGDQIQRREPLKPLTPAQRTKIISQALDRGATLMDTALDIVRIQIRSDAEIAVIKADTERFVSEMEMKIEELRIQGKVTGQLGEAVVQIVDAVTRSIGEIPEQDNESRRALIESLPGLVRVALNRGSSPDDEWASGENAC